MGVCVGIFLLDVVIDGGNTGWTVMEVVSNGGREEGDDVVITC